MLLTRMFNDSNDLLLYIIYLTWFPTSQPTLVVHLLGPAENVSPPDVITVVVDLFDVFVEMFVDIVSVGFLLMSLRL